MTQLDLTVYADTVNLAGYVIAIFSTLLAYQTMQYWGARPVLTRFFGFLGRR